jgi:hypothetical protein
MRTSESYVLEGGDTVVASVDVLLSLAGCVSRTMRPLQDGLESEQAFSDFLRDFGWVVAPTTFSIADVRAALPSATALITADGILAEIEASDTSPAAVRYVELLDAFLNVIEGLEALPGSSPPSGIPAGAWTTFSTEIVDHLVDAYLRERQPGLLGVLLAGGIVTEDEVDPGVVDRVPYIRAGASWDRLAKLFTDPTGLATEIYDWNRSGATLRFEILLARLGRILPLLGLPTVTAVPSNARLDEYYDADNPHRPDIRELKVTLIKGEDQGGSLDVSLAILPIPDTGDSDGPPRGLAIGPSILTTGQAPAVLYGVPFSIDLAGAGGRAKYEGAAIELVPSGAKMRLPASSDATVDARVRLQSIDRSPKIVVGSLFSHRLEYHGIGIEFGARGPIDDVEVILGAELIRAQLVIDLSDGDGLIASAMGEDVRVIEFGVRLVWSSKTGFHLHGSSTIDFVIPLNLSFAGFTIISLHLRAASVDGQVRVIAAVAASLQLGPVTASVADIGTKIDLVPIPAGQPSGMFGRLDLDFGFKPPNGIGIAIDTGAVKGGGFLFLDFDIGRYSGAVELSIFGIAVKAFGVVDTKFPDGSKGFSFVIVISAEFTPIQLGFGFTLVGVGGLVGINRTVDEVALGEAVRTGSLAHLLFPVNVVLNAPAIVHDLSTVFPATRDHHLFGPMAKLGWGTPTLITADLGIIIELPGPRLALLGVVRMLLPSADFAILRLNMAIAGILDFPAGRFEIVASLFDSSVAGYVVSGDMAFRMQLGDRPSFLLSIGGFNPGFQAPAGFPTLRRASADLGVNGNPSLTASGYFAITSNSAQFGASIELRASGYGIRLTGGFGFDVLFVFSPFSFTASVHAGVRVSFHGFGLGVTLHGSMSGPTPWHFKGRVCVEVAFWDACLPIDVTFGREEPAALPEMDPWLGNEDPNVDPRVQVIGLGTAVSDPRNWEGEQPADGYSVVSLAPAATLDRTPIDPVGPATLRQKVCPLNQELEKFGEYVPIVNTHFDVSAVKLAGTEVPYDLVEDEFARGQFENLSTAEKLSASSYDQMVGGVRIAPNRVTAGAAGTHTLEYETVFINPAGERVTEETSDPRFAPTRNQLLGMLKRSSAGRAGVRRSGVQKYMLTGKPKLLTLDAPTFIVVDACTHVWNTTITPVDVSQTLARAKLKAYEKENPSERGRFAVVPFYARAA